MEVFLLVLGVAVVAVLSRWIFRINEILTCEVEMVKRLDTIILLLKATKTP
jgi:hypothetical protein